MCFSVGVRDEHVTCFHLSEGFDPMRKLAYLSSIAGFLAMSFCLSLLLPGCGEEPSDTICDQGTTKDCSCDDGTAGYQQCKEDGTGWNACQCATDAGTDAGGDIDIDAGTDAGTELDGDTDIDAGSDGDPITDAGTDAGNPDTGIEIFEEVGSTTDVGFISLGEHNGKLYAGTYNGGTVHIFSYPPWTEVAALDAGESVYDLESFGGSLYAITENKNRLYVSSNGTAFTIAFTEPLNNLGLGLFVTNNALFATFTCFAGATKGPSLWKTTDGTNFTEINSANWPPVGDTGRIVYEGKPQLNGRTYKNAYTTNYTHTNIYSSVTGDTWNLEQGYNGIKSYMISSNDHIYGLRDGNIVIEYDGTNERDVATGPAVGFHAMGHYKGNLYLLTKTDCWNNCEEAGEGTELYRFDLSSNTFTNIRKFDNQAGVKLRIFNDALFIATKSGRLDAGRRGKLYRMILSGE